MMPTLALRGARSGERTRFAVPVSQVRRMDGRGVDAAATGLTVAAVLAVLGGAAAMVLANLGDW